MTTKDEEISRRMPEANVRLIKPFHKEEPMDGWMTRWIDEWMTR